MDLGLSYNPSELPPPENNYGPVPAGEYLCTIEKTDVKESNKTPGNFYMNVQYSIIGPEYTNRKIFEIINFKNSNEKAEKIAAAQLGDLMRACGLGGRPDSALFIGKNIYIEVGVKKDPQYGDKNDVKSHRAVEGGIQVPSSTPAAVGTKPPFAFQKK